ncbi:GNAT family N-acetyltransferase [Ovoidimarina sediminis]|uniref:GNAT family N-acetyltransferase n=1 Tax=Ovoidimarina sediminis TaxID=3079856 RepID=UPI00290CE308|nr:GNAT family N-acetyltransferase [Rhodophyticola sp. MJ-SS7]MDU8945835.1 GNAT family N-acetyltransferase [Rhodophyticola sp. MJ-SS7]
MTGVPRRLTGGDAAAYRALRLDALTAHPDAYGAGAKDWEARALDEVAALLDTGNTFGVFDGTGLAGIATLVAERGAHQRHLGMVYAVYVTPAARGTGLFDALMSAIEARAKELGLLQLVLHAGHHNARAIAAYQRAGYRITGTIPRALRVGEAFFDEAVMVKALDA